MCIIIDVRTDENGIEGRFNMTEPSTKFTLKALRINKNKTQQEIANLLSVNLRTYQKYESNSDKMYWRHAKILAKYYGISLDLLD